MNWKLLIQKNYHQVFLVFLIFLFMAVGNIVSTGVILRKQLINGANEILQTAESNLRTTLQEPENLLLGAAFNIRDTIANKHLSQGGMRRFVEDFTNWLKASEHQISGFYDFYGIIQGEFLSGTNWEPPDDYVPEERPWYTAAKASPGKIIMTDPYIDVDTNSKVVSFAQELLDDNWESLGVLAMDVMITRLENYVRSLRLNEQGYGLLLNQHMEIMAHPKAELVNKSLGSLNPPGVNPNLKYTYSTLAKELSEVKEISARHIRDTDGSRIIVFFRQLYNGWYVGLVIPVDSFYNDVYQMTIIIFLVGFFLSLILCYMLLRLSVAKIRSDEESKSKSSFLARMSHEIRTPMNAVIGMSELALRAENLPKMTEYVAEIKQAGLNLLSLINDILDLSKIQAGSLQITPAHYLLSSLINDVINIIRVKIVEKPILFIVNVDAGIPNRLMGDEARIRQILLNVLSNAAKYTHEGYIRLTISAEEQNLLEGERRLVLTVKIADSGIGIKQKDLSGLFDNFVRLDIEKNKNIEGTGLGLAITRNLCLAMGGDISVQSEYGKGSVFTVRIPQIYTDDTKLTVIKNSVEKGILFYDDQELHAESLLLTIKNLGLPVNAVVSRDDFLKELRTGAYPFALIPGTWANQAAAIIREGSLKTALAMLMNLGEIAPLQNTPVIVRPAWSVPIANILNGVTQTDYREKAEIRFIAPEARILVVDDIATNLQVAEGLLSLYQIQIDTCTGGDYAIALVKKHHYDLVFMDHMMPGMDGIQATAIIRKMENDYFLTLPIIALTANAVAGMREVFLTKGFNDYLAKPIEMYKLDEIMTRWIPKEKKIENYKTTTRYSKPIAGQDAPAAGSNQPVGFPLTANYSSLTAIGVDVIRGVAMTGGIESAYRKVLSAFHKDALDRLAILGKAPVEEDLSLFTIHAHALKSAAATIGAVGVSQMAKELEAAGKAGDRGLIRDRLPEFQKDLKILAENIAAVLCLPAVETTGPGASLSEHLALVMELKTALEKENIETVDRILAELEDKPFDEKTREALATISDAVLMTEFQEAIEKLSAIC
jgi:signal transduction histidine kinase/CheY-like chemotaxis protein/HPt (histidine-containing phosphotransfer) domain-containing protein